MSGALVGPAPGNRSTRARPGVRYGGAARALAVAALAALVGPLSAIGQERTPVPAAPAAAPALAAAPAPAAAPPAVAAPAVAAGAGPALTGVLPPEQAEQLLRSERFRRLAAELRCLVCQNQTLADSGADLAVDLRNDVLRQMAAGRTDAQIKARLVERYGEFVLYRPTASAHNLALWAGPALLLLVGVGVLWRTTRRRAPARAPHADDARLARIDRALDQDTPH
jgi:cytochrome c-type biogenesis protein CcmH